jgi:hypothetical protein
VKNAGFSIHWLVPCLEDRRGIQEKRAMRVNFDSHRDVSTCGDEDGLLAQGCDHQRFDRV